MKNSRFSEEQIIGILKWPPSYEGRAFELKSYEILSIKLYLAECPLLAESRHVRKRPKADVRLPRKSLVQESHTLPLNTCCSSCFRALTL